VISLLQSSFFIIIFSVVFYLANEQLLALLGNRSWSSGHIGDPQIKIVHSQMKYLDARYFSWLFLGIIWQVNAIFRALGNSKIASRIMLSWLLVKSLVAIVLITPDSSFYLSGLNGLALGHSSVDMLFAVISLLLLHKNIPLAWPSFTELFTAIFSIKLNSLVIVLQQLITPLSIALLTIIAAKISYSYVAAFAFIFRMESIFLLLPMMLTTTMPCIIGTNFWLGYFSRVKRAYIIAFVAVVIVQLLLAIVLFINNDVLSYFICSEGEVAQLLTIYLTWVPIGYIGAGVAIVYQSCLNAEGKPLQASSVGIMHRLILLLPLAIVGGLISTDSSLFQALMIGHLSAALYVIYLFRKRHFTNDKQDVAVPVLLNKPQNNHLGEQT
jgi:Na+-driven multidrug efflux pump